MATMTLLGLYSYNPNLFELLTVPAGIDKGILVDNILTRSADFETLYTDPDFVHDSLRIWSAKWRRTFERWYAALSQNYDPLSNYDRHEEWTDTGSGTKNMTETSAGEESESRSTDGTSTVTGTTTDETSATTENTVSAYNSSAYQPNEKTVTDGESSSSLSNTNTSTTGEEVTRDRSSSTSGSESTASENKRTGRAWGNIGVTTSQQMLEAELSIAEWNLYDHITDIFLSEYVIPVFD